MSAAARKIVCADDLVLDVEVLADIVHGMEESNGRVFLQELADMYIKDAEIFIIAIDESIRNNDANQVRKIAHRLKSGSHAIGTPRLASICQNLESLGQSGELPGAQELVKLLRTEYEQARIALLAEVYSENPKAAANN